MPADAPVQDQAAPQFVALATQHMRWQLNDVALRLVKQSVHLRMSQAGAAVAAPPPGTGSLTPESRFIWAAIHSLALSHLRPAEPGERHASPDDSADC
jgi:hypothetical protein